MKRLKGRRYRSDLILNRPYTGPTEISTKKNSCCLENGIKESEKKVDIRKDSNGETPKLQPRVSSPS